MRTSRIRYGLALASVASLATLSCGALVGAASADPGGVPAHPAQGKHGKHGKPQSDKPGKPKPGKPDKPGNNGKHLGQQKNADKPDRANNGQGNSGRGDNGQGNNGRGNNGQGNNGQAHGHAHAPGQQKDKGPKGQGAQGDPPGNNGTVKIAAPSDAVGHPSNNPHPGCTVVVEWFGFDAGDDVVSTVTFAPQAPTSDVAIGGTSPSSVFVGGDAASGGTDLDGRQAYTLTFEGEPHPKQGYHVKLTVATPRSLGNDTKSKVFWVEPCATEQDTPRGSTSQSFGVPAPPPNPGGPDTPETGTGEPGVPAPPPEDADTPVPTAVDAGEDGSIVPDWATSPVPLMAVAGGLTLVAAGVARRARTRA